MRLKHKSTGVELEVLLPRVYLEVYGGQPFYKTNGGSFIAHSDYDWELVKEDEWDDVTADCETDSYSNSAGEFYSIVHLGGLCFNSADGEPGSGDANVMYKKYGYRLHKIDGLHHGPCFIVERKKA